MSKLVKRHFTFPLEAREADASPVIRGYAAVFEPAFSLDLGGLRETIKRDAFDSTLGKSTSDVLALWSHDWSKPLARQSAGTLKLSTDAHGLAVEITPDGTSWSQDALESVRSGSVKGMSFGFMVDEDVWDYQQKIRTLKRVSLHEVSLVSLPSYPDTEAEVRSLLTEVEASYILAAPTEAVLDLSADTIRTDTLSVELARMALAQRTIQYLSRRKD